MKFDNICECIAIRLLGKPGTAIECIDGLKNYLEEGKVYNVKGTIDGKFLDLDNFGAGFRARRFRKA